MAEVRSRMNRMRRDGFASLMEHASYATVMPFSFSCTKLDKHPFGYSLPQIGKRGETPEVYFVADPGVTGPSVQGLLRLVVWEMTNGGQLYAAHQSITILRVIKVRRTDTPLSDFIYEIGVGGRVFLAGGCTDNEGGTSGQAKAKMDGVMLFLGKIYGQTVHHLELNTSKGKTYMDRLRETLNALIGEQELSLRAWLGKQQLCQRFEVGDKVCWDEGSRPAGSKTGFLQGKMGRKGHLVVEVQELPSDCTCGLSNHAPIELHPVHRCGLRKRYENRHPQLIMVKIKETKEQVSGYYLAPVPAVSRAA